jgi:CHAT domain-containing protein/tetratricopeptide (TPR) repeat protein
LGIGRVYNVLGEKQKALEFFNQSLFLSRATGDKPTQARTLNNIGAVYSDLGEKQKALEFFNQSLPLSQATGDKPTEAATLLGIGRVYSDLGEKQKALEFFNQSLPLSRATGDKPTQARTLNNIGAVYSDLGEKQKALSYYNQSLPLSRATGDKAQEAATLGNIGKVYSDLGEKQKALEFYNQSLPLSRATGYKAQEAVTLNNIGRVYEDLGEKQKALEYYNQSLPLSRATGDKAVEAAILSNMGAVYNALGEKQKALSYYNQSLPLSRATGDKVVEAATLSNIGAVYDALGEKQEALEFYNQSLPLRRTTGDKAGEALTLNNIGGVYEDLGEKQKALEFYNQSLVLSRATGDKAQEAVTLYNFAYLERNRGNLNEAFTQMKAAIEIIEKLRANVASQQLRASYFASVQGYYEFYIGLLMQLHKTNPSKGYDAQALQASERARARSLLEILTEARADVRRGVDTQLVKQERSLQQQLNALEFSRVKLLSGQYTNKDLDAIKQQIESLLTQLDRVQAQIRQENPTYAAITQPGAFTLNLQQIQQQVLDDNTLLLEYSLGSDRSYLWAVTKTGITSYSLPKRADIEVAAKDFSNQLNSPEAVSSPEARKLSQMLLAPVAEQLGQKRLLIVGDGVLQSLPFAALPIPERRQMSVLPPTRSQINFRANSQSRLKTNEIPINSPVERTLAMSQGFEPLADVTSPPVSAAPLLVQNEIVTLPSASTLAVLRNQVKGRQPAPKTLAVLADPIFSPNDNRLSSQPQHNTTTAQSANATRQALEEACLTLDRLNYTNQEAQAILALVPANQRLQALGFDASRATATSPDLAQYRLVHFATHGCVKKERPEFSSVVLSLFDKNGAETDGFLRLHDIFNLNLPAELVVLSACETGLGKDVQGEGLVGLTRGFMYAGAKRVAVSLWSVNDGATAELMKRYYQQMLVKGLNPVAALRAAQLEMWKTQTWKAPYYWAGFVVQGEWK